MLHTYHDQVLHRWMLVELALPTQVQSAFSQAPANNNHIARGAVQLPPAINQAAVPRNEMQVL